MSERIFFDTLVIGWFTLAAITSAALFFVVAPYGRHTRKGWGPAIENRLGWLVMEAPAALVFAACFVAGEHRDTLAGWVFFALWEAHYIYRAFVYPFRLHHTGKRTPLAIVGMAFMFNTVNGYLNGRYLFLFSGGYLSGWLTDLRFLVGTVLFVAGLAINRYADHTLYDLRRPAGSGYAIPQGGLYRWVSCPNYLGEIIEWLGWAVATWSPAGLAFATWVVANLVPRAHAHHRWYREQFADYPSERRALLPGLW